MATILTRVPVAVETRAENDFRLTRAMLEAKVTPKTKLLLINYPNNPTGAVLPREDVEAALTVGPGARNGKVRAVPAARRRNRLLRVRRRLAPGRAAS